MAQEVAATVRDLRTVLAGTYVGGITDPDGGDCVDYMTSDGTRWRIYLSECYGDAVPSEDEILQTAVAIGEMPHSTRDDALPITREELPSEMQAIARVKALGGYSMGVTLTRELKAMGLTRGDQVHVTIRRLD